MSDANAGLSARSELPSLTVSPLSVALSEGVSRRRSVTVSPSDMDQSRPAGSKL